LLARIDPGTFRGVEMRIAFGYHSAPFGPPRRPRGEDGILRIEPSPMTDAELLDGTLRSALALPAQIDLSAVAYGATDGWDSVGHMQLVLGIEEAFGITLDADDVVEMRNYAAVRRILRDRHGLALDD